MKAESGSEPGSAREPDFDTAEEGMPTPNTEGGGRLGVFLHPGRVFTSSEPCIVRTILGSCVAVCMWDSTLGVGGVNHFVLPFSVENGQGSPRFGNVAIQRLIKDLLALGCQKRNLQAKVFGGASVLGAFRDSRNQLGMKNIKTALDLLAGEGIPIIAEDVGGQRGRKVIFQTHDGSAWVRRL
jgi:chemotaxis protein CheD